jgi:hypothetical protein
MLIAKLLTMVTLSFVIIVLILPGHLQKSTWKMTLISTYLSTRTNNLKY